MDVGRFRVMVCIRDRTVPVSKLSGEKLEPLRLTTIHAYVNLSSCIICEHFKPTIRKEVTVG